MTSPVLRGDARAPYYVSTGAVKNGGKRGTASPGATPRLLRP